MNPYEGLPPWKLYLIRRGWIPNSDFTRWMDPMLPPRMTFVFDTAEAFKKQYVQRECRYDRAITAGD